jgi:hypothetical protein
VGRSLEDGEGVGVLDLESVTQDCGGEEIFGDGLVTIEGIQVLDGWPLVLDLEERKDIRHG